MLLTQSQVMFQELQDVSPTLLLLQLHRVLLWLLQLQLLQLQLHTLHHQLLQLHQLLQHTLHQHQLLQLTQWEDTYQVDSPQLLLLLLHQLHTPHLQLLLLHQLLLLQDTLILTQHQCLMLKLLRWDGPWEDKLTPRTQLQL